MQNARQLVVLIEGIGITYVGQPCLDNQGLTTHNDSYKCDNESI